MARISGVNIPTNKKINIALTYIFGIGNKVAGFVGQLSEGAGEFQVFTGIAIFCTLFGILVLFILEPLKRLTHGAEEMDS